MKLRALGLSVWLALGALSPVCAAEPNGWLFDMGSIQSPLKSATLVQQTRVLATPSTARLSFNASSGDAATKATRMMSISLTLEPAGQLTSFDFDAFEGPGAPASKRKLMKVAVYANKRPPAVFWLNAAGWYSADAQDAFVFSHSHEVADPKGAVRDVLTRLAQGAQRIEVSVLDSRNRAVALSASFDVEQNQAGFKALLATKK